MPSVQPFQSLSLRTIPLLLSLAMAALLGCRGDVPSASDKPKDAAAAREAKPGALETAADEQHLRVLATLPDFELQDQTGNPYGLAQLRGRAWIAHFIFTRCQSTCPRQTDQLVRLQQRLRKEPSWDEIRIVSISVEPEFDSPQVLQKYAQYWAADAEHWRFLTGSRDSIWKLSKEGFKLPVGENPQASDMPIFHSSQFVLVDRAGQIRGFYDGLADRQVANLQRDLQRVLAEE